MKSLPLLRLSTSVITSALEANKHRAPVSTFQLRPAGVEKASSRWRSQNASGSLTISVSAFKPSANEPADVARSPGNVAAASRLRRTALPIDHSAAAARSAPAVRVPVVTTSTAALFPSNSVPLMGGACSDSAAAQATIAASSAPASAAQAANVNFGRQRRCSARPMSHGDPAMAAPPKLAYAAASRAGCGAAVCARPQNSPGAPRRAPARPGARGAPASVHRSSAGA